MRQSNPISAPEALLKDIWIFQEVNLAVHSSHATKEFLWACDVRVLEWAVSSPDLNITGNVWEQLVRVVYGNGWQYNSCTDLQNEIMDTWNRIDLRHICSLHRSISTRLINVVENHGKIRPANSCI